MLQQVGTHPVHRGRLPDLGIDGRLILAASSTTGSPQLRLPSQVEELVYAAVLEAPNQVGDRCLSAMTELLSPSYTQAAPWCRSWDQQACARILPALRHSDPAHGYGLAKRVQAARQRSRSLHRRGVKVSGCCFRIFRNMRSMALTCPLEVSRLSECSNPTRQHLILAFVGPTNPLPQLSPTPPVSSATPAAPPEGSPPL
mmetsp:Transcript_41141/g.94642  ORF Transcript_41141/g.94642 Transcript_41141/m.94642 type:complete len:200 (+) Transcript_41141:324-923(+)